MHLFIVECRRESDPDEARLGLVIASAIEEAEETCRRAYSQDGYAFFKVRLVVEGQFPGPVRELALPGGSFLGDPDFDGICIWPQMLREVARGAENVRCRLELT